MIKNTLFHNRHHAGTLLATDLQRLRQQPDTLILALPRGGVPVAAAIAQILKLPLDVFLVRKLGVPGQEELAMGALTELNTIVWNEDILKSIAISDTLRQQKIAEQQVELNRRLQIYRQGKALPSLQNKTILLVDDGLATGATMRAAVYAIAQQSPKAIVVAVPVADRMIYHQFKHMPEITDCICHHIAEYLSAVGAWYEDFTQTTDEEVVRALGRVSNICQ